MKDTILLDTSLTSESHSFFVQESNLIDNQITTFQQVAVLGTFMGFDITQDSIAQLFRPPCPM